MDIRKSEFGRIMRVIKDVLYNRGTPKRLMSYRRRIERYRDYLKELRCPVCGRRFNKVNYLMNHLWNSKCGLILYNDIKNDFKPRYILDLHRGEIIDIINGEVVEDHVMVYEEFDEKLRVWKLIPII